MIKKVNGASPLVSVVIPNFNREDYLAETLQSLLDQSYRYWEALVVDDGSTDRSVDIIREFCARDKRFRFFRREGAVKGAPVCRNIGAQQAIGDYLLFLDSDDVLAPYCLQQRVDRFARDPQYDCLVFPMLIFHKTPGDSPVLWSAYKGADALGRFIDGAAPWQTSGPLWKREAVRRLGGWDEGAATWQDWEYHIRALASGIRYGMADVLPDCFLRRADHDRISAGDMRPDRLQAKLRLFDKVYRLLEAGQLVTPAYQRSFTRLFFIHAERTAIRWPAEGLAAAFLAGLQTFELVPPVLFRKAQGYVAALRLSKKTGLSFVTSLLYKTARRFFPDYLLQSESKEKAPELPADALAQVLQKIAKQRV